MYVSVLKHMREIFGCVFTARSTSTGRDAIWNFNQGCFLRRLVDHQPLGWPLRSARVRTNGSILHSNMTCLHAYFVLQQPSSPAMSFFQDLHQLLCSCTCQGFFSPGSIWRNILALLLMLSTGSLEGSESYSLESRSPARPERRHVLACTRSEVSAQDLSSVHSPGLFAVHYVLGLLSLT